MTDEQRAEKIKAVILAELDHIHPSMQPSIAARIFGQILERLSRRDTSPVFVPPIPRSDPP